MKNDLKNILHLLQFLKTFSYRRKSLHRCFIYRIIGCRFLLVLAIDRMFPTNLHTMWIWIKSIRISPTSRPPTEMLIVIKFNVFSFYLQTQRPRLESKYQRSKFPQQFPGSWAWKHRRLEVSSIWGSKWQACSQSEKMMIKTMTVYIIEKRVRF